MDFTQGCPCRCYRRFTYCFSSRLFAFHLVLAVSASLFPPTICNSLPQALRMSPSLTPSAITSRPTISSRPSHPLSAFLLRLRVSFGWADDCAHLQIIFTYAVLSCFVTGRRIRCKRSLNYKTDASLTRSLFCILYSTRFAATLPKEAFISLISFHFISSYLTSFHENWLLREATQFAVAETNHTK